MEVSLPPPQIPEDFNDPVVLGQQLEHMQEGHYSRRLQTYIEEERQNLLNSIAADWTNPALRGVREELLARAHTTEFVKNALEQLAVLYFQHLDLLKEFEALDELMKKTKRKLDELINYDKDRCWYLRYFRNDSWVAKRQEQCLELVILLDHCKNMGRKQFNEYQHKFVFNFERLVRIVEEIPKRWTNLVANGVVNIDLVIDGMLRKCVLEYNACPVGHKVTRGSVFISEQEKFQDKIESVLRSFENWIYETATRDKEDAIMTGILYGSVFILVCKIIFRKRI